MKEVLNAISDLFRLFLSQQIHAHRDHLLHDSSCGVCLLIDDCNESFFGLCVFYSQQIME